MTHEELMERIRDPKQALDYILHVNRTGDVLDLKMAVEKVAIAQENRKEGGS